MLAVALFLGSHSLTQTARLEELFSSWGRAQKSLTSLAVEFDFERDDLIRRKKQTWVGRFFLARAKDGRVSASFGLRTDVPGQDFYGVLLDRKIYELDLPNKRATEFTPDDPQRFLAKHFFPLAVLLDRERSAEAIHLRVERSDSHYTYLSARSKRAMWRPAFFDEPVLADMAVLNVDTPDVPRDMPCLIQYAQQDYMVFRYRIRRWQIDPKGGVDAATFVDPSRGHGWQVGRWPTSLGEWLMTSPAWEAGKPK